MRLEDQQRLNIDLALCYCNNDQIKAATGLDKKVTAVFSGNPFADQAHDPDTAIYSGGFFSESDKLKMAKIRMTSPEKLPQFGFTFSDTRLPEMLFRYRARNYPDTLNMDEKSRWAEFCTKRLTGQQAGGGITVEAYQLRLQELSTSDTVKAAILDELSNYVLSILG
jgi:exodeoxyribonuclease-1